MSASAIARRLFGSQLWAMSPNYNVRDTNVTANWFKTPCKRFLATMESHENMNNSVPMVEIWRGNLLESVHRGSAVICDAKGDIRQAWGDASRIIYPRSSSKILQGIPLIESGAADALGLSDRHLSIACASHIASDIHTELVASWLGEIGLSEEALRCGPQEPDDIAARNALIQDHKLPCQIHNTCSGKHTGFLTLGKHLGAGPEYIDPDHPVQLACRDVFEEMTGEDSPGFGVDGCSAPNFQTSLTGLARAFAKVAVAQDDATSTRERAAARLRNATIARPEMVTGEGGACTSLIRACQGRATVKYGAEAVYVAALPDLGLGVALKVYDGANRAAEAAIAAILVHLGVLDPKHPVAQRFIDAPVLNRRNLTVGRMRIAEGFA